MTSDYVDRNIEIYEKAVKEFFPDIFAFMEDLQKDLVNFFDKNKVAGSLLYSSSVIHTMLLNVLLVSILQQKLVLRKSASEIIAGMNLYFVENIEDERFKYIYREILDRGPTYAVCFVEGGNMGDSKTEGESEQPSAD